MRVIVVLVLLAASGVTGCGPRGQGPEDTLRAFAEALREGRYEDAYAFLDEGYRRRVAPAELRRHLEAHPEEVRRLVGLLSNAVETEEITAVVPVAGEEALTLRRDDGDWRVEGATIDFYDQSTPRNAVRAFVRAMQRRRYDVVLRLVPTADREGMSEERMREAFEGEAREEVERLVATLRESLDAPIEVVGDRATMAYGEGSTVQLVREGELWKIEDPD
ncbi:MAG: hypothetical protein H6721_10505 [Sandaracinus sp.]|nr:hypothetical protein [Sandaracinus sp.]MCB9632549.1 hypothetical protein [Sandaracinus sp.]